MFSKTLHSFCSVLSVHLTSSKSLVGITGVVSEIQKEKKVFYFFIEIRVPMWISYLNC